MDTTVITVDEADYGVGATDRVTFVDSKYTMGEDGSLHVYRGQDGNVASFPPGKWRAVIRGNPVTARGVTAVER